MKKQFSKLILRVFLTVIMTILMTSTAWATDVYEVVNNSTSVYYETLEDAISNATSGNSITLMADVEIESTIAISNKDLTLDLNGYDIHMLNGGGSVFKLSGTMVWQYYALTLKDSDGANKGTRYISGTGSSAAITNENMSDDEGYVAVTGGVIYGGFNYMNGGGIFVDGGAKLVMTGGTIAGNNTTYNGGGSITENTATKNGDSVYFTTTMNVENAITIDAGDVDGDGVYLNGKTINVTGSISGASIAVSASKNDVVAQGSNYTLTEADFAAFSATPIDSGKILVLDTTDNNIVYTAYAASVQVGTDEATSYGSIEDAIAVANEATDIGEDKIVVTLLDDVETTETLTIENTNAIDLYLNGYKIDGSNNNGASVITVNSGATLNLYDDDEDEITTYNPNPSYEVTDPTSDSDGTVIITTGLITGGIRGVDIDGGTLNVFGGNIAGMSSANEGVGVYLSSGTFSMSGGAIAYNKSTNNYFNGAVYVKSGTFYLSDTAEIKNNIALTGTAVNSYGGGVYIDAGSLYMSGGSITGNVAYYSAGIYFRNAAKTSVISGGTISGNTSTSRGGVETNGESVTISSGTITDNYAGSYERDVTVNGTTTISGGTIGVVSSSSTLTMSGGTVNRVTVSDGTFEISGYITITEGVTLATGKTITIKGALTNSTDTIAVTATDGEGAKIATDGGTVLSTETNYASKFTSTQGDIFYRTSDDSIYIAKVEAVSSDFSYTNTTVVYDGAEQDVDVTLIDDDNATITVYYSTETGENTFTEAMKTAPTNVGTYYVFASITSSDYFEMPSDTTAFKLGTLVIAQATPTATSEITGETVADSYTSTYEDTLTFSIQLDSLDNSTYPTGSVQFKYQLSGGEVTDLGSAVTLEDGYAEYTGVDNLVAGNYTISYVYTADSSSNYASKTFTDSLTVNKKAITFDATGTTVSYESGKRQYISFATNTNLTDSAFTVNYYDINEAKDTIDTEAYTNGVIDAGTYLYVITLNDTSGNYKIDNSCTIETAYSTISGLATALDCDNTGLFVVQSGATEDKESLNGISFAATFVTDWVVGATEQENTLTNPNTVATTVSYESSDTSVAEVDTDGQVTIKSTGSATITATVSAVESGYTSVTASYVIIVGQQTVVVTVDGKDITYGDTVSYTTDDLTYTISGVEVKAEDINPTTTGLTFSTTYTQGSNIGSYTVSASGLVSSDYIFIYQSGTITVSPIELDKDDFAYTVTAKAYDGNKSITGTLTVKTDSVYNSDSLTVNYNLALSSEDIGANYAIFTLTGLSGAKVGNYTLGISEIESMGTDYIYQNKVTFTFGSISVPYTGSNQEMVITATDVNGNVFTDFTVKYTKDSETETSTPNAVGEYAVEITLTDDNNYTFADSTAVANVIFEITSIDQDYLAIVGTPGTIEYGDTFTLSTSGGTTGGTASWGITSGDNYATISDDGLVTITGVGEVTVKVTYTADNYNNKVATVTFTSTAKNVNITLGSLMQTYTGSALTATATYPTITADNNENDIATATIDYGTGYAETTPTNAGSYPFVATATGNYTGTVYGTLTISKADVVIVDNISVSVTDSDSDATITYGETVKTTVSYGASAPSDYATDLTTTITYGTSNGKAPTDAGTYEVYVTFASDNYNSVTVTKEFTIAQKELTVSADSVTRTFGEANPTFTLTYDGFVDGETAVVLDVPATASTTYDATTDAGTYTGAITVDISSASDNNYSFVKGTDGTLTIEAIVGGTYLIVGNKNTLSIDEELQLYAYTSDGIENNVTWTVTGDDEIITITEGGLVTATGAGTAEATASYGANYDNETATYEITVGKEDITLTVVGLEDQVYDSEQHAVTFTYDEKEFIDVIVTYTPITGGSGSTTAPTNAGSYLVTYVVDSELYTGSGNAILYIAQAEYTDLSITASDIVYDSEEYDGLVITAEDVPSEMTQTVSYSIGKTPTDVGTYTVTVTYSDPNGNYKDATASDEFAITTLGITVKVNNETISYGDSIPGFEIVYTYTEDSTQTFANTSDIAVLPTAKTTATSSSAVGDYTIEVSGGYDPNYTFTYVNGELTIEAADGDDVAEFTILNSQATATLGESFTATAAIDGLVTSDVYWISDDTSVVTVDGNTGLVVAVGAGSTIITATYTGDNYMVGTPTTSFEITVIETTGNLTFGDLTHTYDGTAKSVTLTNGSDDGFVVIYDTDAIDLGTNSVKVTYDGEETLPTEAGTYAVEYTIVSNDYVGTGSATMTINKATLTVSVEDAEREYGEEDPEFTITYSGFVNGEDESELDTSPTATTTSSTTSVAGSTHTITISGGEDNNYDFSYGTGTLTINKATVDENNTFTILGGSATMGVDTEVDVVAVLDTVTVGAYWISSDTSIATVVDGKITAVSAGEVTITATLDDANYEGDTVIAILTINVLNNSVTLVPNETIFEYNGYAQELTFTASDVTLDLTNLSLTYYDKATNEVVSELRNAGTYDVVYSLNENSTLINGSTYVTITKADVTVQPTNKEKTYGDENPELTFFGLLGDDRTTYYDDYAEMFVLSTDADETSDVGDYDITMEFADGHTATSSRNYNFTISSTNGTLDIIPRELFFQASDVTREYGEENPTPEYTVEGFVNGDGDDIDDQLVFTYLTTDETSNVGTYTNEIKMSGYANDNYDISFGRAADLEITAIDVTVSATTSRSTYLQVKFSEIVDPSWLTFTVTDSNGDAVTITSTTDTAGTNFYLYGSFSTSTTYTVLVQLEDSIGNYTMADTTLSIKPTSTSSSSSSGGSSGGETISVYYSIEILENETSDYGTVDIDTSSKVVEGKDVTITATPNDGYEAKSVVILDEDGNEVDYTVDGDEYEFEMPDSDVTIEVTFVSDVLANLTDVSSSDWYYDAVEYVLTHGLFYGISETEFGPDVEMSRSMMVTVLHRLDGLGVVNYIMSFEDVLADTWYTEGVRWGQSNGIVSGYSNEIFNPDKSITREELVVIIYRYMNYIDFDVTVSDEDILDTFTDKDSIQSYAVEAMTWACDAGIVKGYTDGEVKPQNTATRAEVATVVMRIAEMIK
ncbi:MAG: MBG domain-containing protein [Clostridia bacterium]